MSEPTDIWRGGAGRGGAGGGTLRRGGVSQATFYFWATLSTAGWSLCPSSPTSCGFPCCAHMAVSGSISRSSPAQTAVLARDRVDILVPNIS